MAAPTNRTWRRPEVAARCGSDALVFDPTWSTRPHADFENQAARSAISIMERPMMFRMSTRNRSDHGAHPQAIRNSCRRKRSPKARISAPRRAMLQVISAGVRFLRMSLSVTRAKEIPARNRKSGAGSVPRRCDH